MQVNYKQCLWHLSGEDKVSQGYRGKNRAATRIEAERRIQWTSSFSWDAQHPRHPRRKKQGVYRRWCQSRADSRGKCQAKARLSRRHIEGWHIKYPTGVGQHHHSMSLLPTPKILSRDRMSLHCSDVLIISKDLGKGMMWDVKNGPGNCLSPGNGFPHQPPPSNIIAQGELEGWWGQAEKKQLDLRNQGARGDGTWERILVQKLGVYGKEGGVQEHGGTVLGSFLFQLRGERRRVAVWPDQLPYSFPFWQNVVSIP